MELLEKKKKPNRTMIECKCIQCGETYLKSKSQAKAYPPKYCSLKCSGKARAIGRDEVKRRHAEYVKEKMANDPEFRKKRLARKREYYQENKERIEARMKPLRRTAEYRARHADYCRRDQYRESKKYYDRSLRCRKRYGEFAEAASHLIDLENLIKTKATDYEIRLQQGTLNKAQKRKRTYETKCR